MHNHHLTQTKHMHAKFTGLFLRKVLEICRMNRGGAYPPDGAGFSHWTH